MPASALDNPFARQQKALLYVLPLFFAISGINFPIGVLIYWLTTNLWSMGQQFYVIRRMPAPGSAAEAALLERRRRKSQGLEPEPAVATGADERTPGTPGGGQRQQPKRQKRNQRGATRARPPPPRSARARPVAGWRRKARRQDQVTPWRHVTVAPPSGGGAMPCVRGAS